MLTPSAWNLKNVPTTICPPNVMPYPVLAAPELADDVYLNLVDWSSMNVLGVGLGSCVYLWTAHNAAVSKLCDLASPNDTVSSVSWVQKVHLITYPLCHPSWFHAYLLRGTMLVIGTLSGRM
jgi:cell division cycle 20-like protein 1 (cofactor of APC complex)